jgi:uncharacterized protein (DUF58 family)
MTQSARFRLARPLLYWLPVAAVLALIGWSKTINLLLLLGYLMLALCGVNTFLAWRMIRRVAGQRRETPPVFAGERLVHTVEVRNPTTRGATVRIADETVGQVGDWFLAPLPGGESTVLRVPWSFPKRGRYAVGPLVVDSEYPFGLVRWTRELQTETAIRVLPAVGNVSVESLRRWLIRAGGGEGRTRRPSRRPTPGLGDVRGVRPYRVGDSPRDIHWKTTARRNQLVVREYDQTDPLNLVLILDPWLPATGATAEQSAALEWALAVVMSIGWAWGVADEPGNLTLVIPGTPPEVHTARASTAFVRQAFASLADIAGMETVPSVPLSAMRVSAVRTARLVVSSRPNSPLAGALRSVGLPTASVDPSMLLRWYRPATLPEPTA